MIYGTRDRNFQFFGPNLTVKRGTATEADGDGEIEEVDNGDDEDSSNSDLIIVSQTEHGRTYCCGGPVV